MKLAIPNLSQFTAAVLLASSFLPTSTLAFNEQKIKEMPEAEVLELVSRGHFAKPQPGKRMGSDRYEQLCAWVEADRRNIVETIVGRHPDAVPWYPLLACAPTQEAYDHWKSLGASNQRILKVGAREDSDSLPATSLQVAAGNLNVASVKAHLADGVDVHARGGMRYETALGLALAAWEYVIREEGSSGLPFGLEANFSSGRPRARTEDRIAAEKIVRMLFEAGASFDALSGGGYMAQYGVGYPGYRTPGETYRSDWIESAKERFMSLKGKYYRIALPRVLAAESYGREIFGLMKPCMNEDEAACQQVVAKADSESPTRALAEQQLTRLTQERADWAALLARQACAMNYDGWAYTGKSCAQGRAQGPGHAVKWRTGDKFEGEFVRGGFAAGKFSRRDGRLYFEGRFNSDGSYASGRVFEEGLPAYEGEFKAGKRHGQGLCWVRGAVEECRYFEGERIDALHKQRQENQRLQDELKKEADLQRQRQMERAQEAARQRREQEAEDRRDRRNAQALAAGIASMRGDYSAAAAAGVPGADTLRMQQQMHQREQQMLAEQRLLQQAAENNRREQARRDETRQQTQQRGSVTPPLPSQPAPSTVSDQVAMNSDQSASPVTLWYYCYHSEPVYRGTDMTGYRMYHTSVLSITYDRFKDEGTSNRIQQSWLAHVRTRNPNASPPLGCYFNQRDGVEKNRDEGIQRTFKDWPASTVEQASWSYRP